MMHLLKQFNFHYIYMYLEDFHYSVWINTFRTCAIIRSAIINTNTKKTLKNLQKIFILSIESVIISVSLLATSAISAFFSYFY